MAGTPVKHRKRIWVYSYELAVPYEDSFKNYWNRLGLLRTSSCKISRSHRTDFASSKALVSKQTVLFFELSTIEFVSEDTIQLI